MSCACRENKNIFERPGLLFRKTTWTKRWGREYMWRDTWGFLKCKIIGHDPYVVASCDNAVACRSCGKFIPQ